jgi:hypothetical protein
MLQRRIRLSVRLRVHQTARQKKTGERKKKREKGGRKEEEEKNGYIKKSASVTPLRGTGCPLKTQPID